MHMAEHVECGPYVALMYAPAAALVFGTASWLLHLLLMGARLRQVLYVGSDAGCKSACNWVFVTDRHMPRCVAVVAGVSASLDVDQAQVRPASNAIQHSLASLLTAITGLRRLLLVPNLAD